MSQRDPLHFAQISVLSAVWHHYFIGPHTPPCGTMEAEG